MGRKDAVGPGGGVQSIQGGLGGGLCGCSDRHTSGQS